jgi:outer membrane receptor protein involved in Fe transport
MNKSPWTLAVVVATAVSFMNSPSVLAQTGDEDANSVLEEVLVTATKREESIYEVPIAITAFSQAGIERQGITDLTDIGKFVPNLNVTGFSAGHTSSVNPFIRGIGLQDHLITTDPGVPPTRVSVSTSMVSISAARSGRTGRWPISSEWRYCEVRRAHCMAVTPSAARSISSPASRATNPVAA